MNHGDVELLQNPQVAELLNCWKESNPSDCALALSKKTEIPSRIIAEQIDCLKRLPKKFPTLDFSSFFFDKTAFEQSSCQATALYKSTLISGKRFLDMTGGLGIDTLICSGNFNTSVYCEKNDTLFKLFLNNMQKYATKGIECRFGDSLEILKEYPDFYFDWIYVDPSRRVGGKRKVSISDCLPDLNSNSGFILRKTGKMVAKMSPLLELSEAQKALKGIHAISAVSVDGECKELLCFCSNNGFQKEVELRSVLLGSKGEIRYEVSGNISERGIRTNFAAQPMEYLFEPDAAIIKCGLSDKVAKEFGLSFLNKSTDFLTGRDFSAGFPGRIFLRLDTVKWNRNKVRDYLKKSGIKNANVIRRDFKMDPDAIKKMLSLGDGGDQFLMFTISASNEPVVHICRKAEGLNEK